MKSERGNAAEADDTMGVADARSNAMQLASGRIRDRPDPVTPRMCVCNTSQGHKSGDVPAIHELFARASPSALAVPYSANDGRVTSLTRAREP